MTPVVAVKIPMGVNVPCGLSPFVQAMMRVPGSGQTVAHISVAPTHHPWPARFREVVVDRVSLVGVARDVVPEELGVGTMRAGDGTEFDAMKSAMRVRVVAADVTPKT